MKALVYHGPGNCSYEEKPMPVINESTDAIVRITKTSICGTDLHIMKGDIPSVKNGKILGHEGVGIIWKAGSSVTNFCVGDHVLISSVTACGKCPSCKKGMYSHCEDGGWILGNIIDGTQAEYVRIPFADHSLYAIPEGADEEALVMLSDILPTGFECGILSGQVKPGDTVAIIGAGPVGLAALLTAQFYSPADIIMVDNDDSRLEAARKFGAAVVIHNDLGNAAEKIMALTGNRGVDVAIEATGNSAGFDICQTIVAAGGHIANIGVHGRLTQLNLDKLRSQNITLTTGLADTVTIPMLLKTVLSGKIQPRQLITHHFMLDQVMQAYEIFGNAMKAQSLKIIITNAEKIKEDVQVSDVIYSDTLSSAILEGQATRELLTANDSPGG